VSRQSLAGEAGSLNERTIGEAVFERSPDYDPRDDNIVRSHASRLRVRLEEYFQGEGAAEELRVAIPRGSYAPVFEPAAVIPGVAEGTAPSRVSAPPEENSGRVLWLPAFRTRASAVLLASLALLAVAAAGAVYLGLSLRETPTHKLWSQMFRKDQQTLIVPADSSLVIARLLVGHQITLADYAGGQYKQAVDCSRPCDLAMVRTVEAFRYTSMSDLEYAVKVSHRPEAILNRTEIRFARDLELKDLKESNLILAGSQEADPWLAALSEQMSFVVHDDPSAGPLRVENRKPKAGEKSEYPYDYRDPQHRGLATIAFLPNLSGNGNILVVQGFSLAGTQAAAEFVTSGKDLDVLLRQYSGLRTKLPHFEVLLSTVEINGMASRGVPLAWHVLP